MSMKCKRKKEIIDKIIRGLIVQNELNNHYLRALLLLNEENKEVDNETGNEGDSKQTGEH